MSNNMPIVQPNSYLTLHYRITLNSGQGQGQVFIETFGHKPATMDMASEQWTEGLKRPLLGHTEGESFSYEVSATEGFGHHRAELVIPVTKATLALNGAADRAFAPEELVEFPVHDGTKVSGVFKQWIDEQTALFDFNHPLSGVDLRVDVELLAVM